LQSSEILLKAIMDGGRHSIIVTAPDGMVTFINHAAERMYGFQADDFTGKPISELRRRIYEPDDLQREAREIGAEAGRPVTLDEMFRVALERRVIYERERVAIRSDGSRFHVLVTITAMRDAAGALAGYLSVSQDISERKRLEQLKNEFITTVSHELRTPLTSIRGALGLMAGGAAGVLPQAAAELAVIAHRNCERLVRIVNDILDMEKIESGKLDFQTREFDLTALLAASLEENKAYGDKHGIMFVFKGSAEPLPVLADRDRVSQVVANLLSNAAKFSPKGGEVHVTLTGDGGMARVAVRDFGAGIPESFRPRIFEKFAQSEAGGAVGREGTGLGLSISRKLVEAMGGAIGFDTLTGEGTTFMFTLPLAPSAQSRATADEAVAEGTGQEGAVTGDAAGPSAPARDRILVCEDDRDVARLLTILLDRAGFAADAVHDLAAARAAVRTGRYVALTLDLILPDGDGLEFLAELRADPATRELPVMVISAVAERGRDWQEGHPVELVDWISKPIDEAALTRALHRAARKTGHDVPRILHVEDDGDLRRVLHDLFNGRAEWVGVSSLHEARERLRRESFDLVVLDLGLPDGSGVELMEQIETSSGGPVPVLILSAADAVDGDLRRRVASVLLKSRVSEEHIVQTVLRLVRERPSS